MKIVKIEVHLLSIKLRDPLTISFHTFDYQDNYFIRLHTAEGLTGWGEAAPFKPITGDSAEEVLGQLKKLRISQIPDLNSTENFYNDFLAPIATPSLRAALDLAAHDLIARQRGIPVYRLYRPTARILPNCVTVFIKGDLRKTQDETKRILELYPHLKLLKIKLKGEHDLERCAAIKQLAPPHLRFVLDANQGFSDAGQAAETLNQAVKILGDVMVIEEPCPKGQYAMMKQVKDQIPTTRIFADESCATENDLEDIIREQCAGGINIKLQKCGGITPARRMARRAAQAGMLVMVGSMFEDALGTSAGVHLATSTDNVILTDLDMDLDLPSIWSGMAPFDAGSRLPIEQPGFAFALDLQKIAGFLRDAVKLTHLLSIE